ncbi:MAG: HD domain-containing phosphohydrolase [Gemmatimonadaceae bacterium]
MTAPEMLLPDRRTVRVLLVDDEEAIRLSLSTFLTRSGYEVETASSATQALEMLDAGRFSLMLSDIRMPGMTGVELVPKALATNPDLAIVMLTAVNDAPTATEALSLGAMGYLTKPVELPDLHESILKALHRREMLLQQREIDHVIREEVTLRTAELEREKSLLRDLTIQVAESLVIAMEAKNPYMRGRSIRIGEMAAAVADQMSLDVDTVEAVRLAGRLMDVGKIGIREEILNKPGSLTPEEYAHVKQHVEMGISILAPMKHLGSVLDFIRDHHEHCDGSGYPRQISDKQISVGGRILAAVDAYDALTSGRAYQEPMQPHTTLEYLSERVGSLIDSDVFLGLSSVVRRRRSLTFITAIPN